MIKYIRRDTESLSNDDWDTFFTNFNNNIIKAKLEGTNTKLANLKAHANEIQKPIVLSFDITGSRIVPTPNPNNFAGDVVAHNNAISEISVINYLTNLHYIGNGFPSNPSNAEPSTRKKIHMTDIFLPWHRLFLIEFEELLGSPIHYWNWYSNQEIPEKLKIANLKDVVKNGNVKFYLDLNRSTEDLADGTLGTSKKVFKEAFVNSWRSLFNSATIDKFVNISNTIEYNMHNNMHSSISGDAMGNIFFSPYDPIFWFHHSFVDKIWADFYNTLSNDEKTAITDYPNNELPFFTKKAEDVKDIKKQLMVSFQGLFKDRTLVSNP
jgi:tyrosinase